MKYFSMRLATILNRSLSLLVVIGYLIISGTYNGVGNEFVKAGVCSLIPLCFIWFGEQIGSFTGYLGRGGNIDIESPGWLVCIMGWFFLVGIPIILYFANRG